jgi:diaminohydroxyphosphoribosylaminopyrimidine deaminase/5-amino-6-(5-phosphoribosylamino)uracil reductase
MPGSGDDGFMRRAIELARAHVGLTGRNPSVGCVIVQDGTIVGQGVTAEGGRPHAEEMALTQAGEAARGATAFVTLEPCGERSSGSPACGARLAAARVGRVVVACADTSAFASGRGLEQLRAAGIQVEIGALAAEAAGLYADYRPDGGAQASR